MATLADLKARIISETLRDDLSDDLATQFDGMIAGAISELESTRFFFTEKKATSACVPGARLQPLPGGTRIVDAVWLVVGGVRYRMRAESRDVIETLYAVPLTGQPTDYAVVGPNIDVWPTPNIAYGLIWNLVAVVTPVLDYTVPASANDWTNDGQDLICATTKKRLYRDYLSTTLSDPRLQNALAQEASAYANLQARTNRLISTGRVAASW